MSEEKRIIDPIERAILKSFSIATSGDLKRKTIIKFVQTAMPSSSESAIAKRIELLAKEKNYLVTSGRGYYRTNPKYSFVFDVDVVPGALDKTREIRKDEVREHTLHLKDAIRNWAFELSIAEPCHEHPLAYGKSSSNVIASCERHVLFSDLTNHMPNLGSTVCSDWDGYKRELEELDRLKDTLLSYVENEIRKCFEGMKLVFAYDNDEGRYYECHLIQNILYNITLEAGQEGYDEHMSELISLRDIPIKKHNDYCFWSEYLTVPAKDLELLKEGVDRFLVLFGNSVDAPEFRDIVVKVNSLKTKRDNILRELDRLLKYTSFPGECEYLREF